MGRILLLGSLNADLVVRAERLPAPGETLSGDDLEIYPGGKGANQAAAASKLGVPTTLVGAVGRDAFGDLLLEAQRRLGVDCSSVERVERSTGVAMITVLPDGQNSILLSPGANQAIANSQAQAACVSLAAGDILLCQLETPLEVVTTALQAARSRGATTILDPAPARDLPAETLQSVDILTPNETEAAALTGLPEDADPTVVAQALLERGPKTVILKRGSRGSYTASDSIRFSTPAVEVEAVDTTAAGDVFNGALAAALCRQEPLDAAVQFATAAAAISVTRRGAQPSAPSLEEVKAAQ